MRWQELKHEWDKNPKRREAMQREFPYRKLADELVALRASLGLTQSQLAKKMKTTQSTVARFESGRQAITVKTLDRVASSLGFGWTISFDPIETLVETTLPTMSIPRAHHPGLRDCRLNRSVPPVEVSLIGGHSRPEFRLSSSGLGA